MSTLDKLHFDLGENVHLVLESTVPNKPLKPLDSITVRISLKNHLFEFENFKLEEALVEFGNVFESLTSGGLQTTNHQYFSVCSGISQYNVYQDSENFYLEHPHSLRHLANDWFEHFRLIYQGKYSAWVYHDQNRYKILVTENFDFEPWLDKMPTPNMFKELMSSNQQEVTSDLDFRTTRKAAQILKSLFKLSCEYHQYKNDFNLEDYR